MKYKNVISKVLIGTLLVIFHINAFSYIYHNGSGTAYDQDQENEKAGTGPIEFYIIDGADYFFSAYLDTVSMLKMYELQDRQGVDYDEFNDKLENAIANMTNAVKTYDNLIREAEFTPYNKDILERLAAFDYLTFMMQNDLNPAVFEKVENYLKKGDITGAYKRTYATFMCILELLKLVKEEFSPDNLPGLSVMWKLNELYSETSLFGSYVSRVFHAVL